MREGDLPFVVELRGAEDSADKSGTAIDQLDLCGDVVSLLDRRVRVKWSNDDL
jgi:hypothetical protein